MSASQSTMDSQSTFASAVACIAVAGVCACGTTDRDSDAAAVVAGFHGALAQQDGETACGHLSEETVSKLEQQQRKPCAEAILDLQLPQTGTAAKTSVYVTTAAVLSRQGTTTVLDEAADGWKISAAGCERAVRDMPYDCELEN